MAVLDIIMKMRQEMEEELVSNILPFWINLKSASNLNGNLNCSKELEHYAS